MINRPSPTDTEQYNVIALGLGAMLVPEVAPDEQSDYASIVTDYLEQSKKQTSDDHPIAFGMGDLVQLATPLIFEASKVVAIYLTTELGLAAKDIATETIKTGQEAIKTRVSKWLKDSLSPTGPQPLTHSQRSTIMTKVTARLVALKADERTKQSIVRTLEKTL